MTATTGQAGVPAGAGPRWHVLLRPRWLAWHAFAVLATAGMLYLGDWQLHRALSGNELSWAYTFEWPLFAVFGVYFWIKSLRDELRQDGLSAQGADGPGEAAAGPARLTPADGEAYAAWLKSEVQHRSRWQRWR